MKQDLFSSSSGNTIVVEHNGRTYRLEYTGKMKKHETRRFCEWATSPIGVAFIHDAHHEIVTGLDRRRIHTKKPAQLSGYVFGQWVRFIYGHNYSNTWGPVTAKLLAAVYPEHADLFKSKT